MGKRLCLSSTNRRIAGVCGGLGEYFNIDPTIFRILLGAAFLIGGWGLLPYVILWAALPRDSKEAGYSPYGDDIERSLNQSIFYMQQQYKQAEVEINRALEDEKNLERVYEEQMALQQVWMRKAEMAVEAGNDTLALEAIKRKNQVEQMAAHYQEQLDEQKKATSDLKRSLMELEQKIQEAVRKKNILVAQKNRAQAQEYMYKAMSDLKGLKIFNTFDKVKQKVRDMEDQNLAYKEIHEDPLAKEFEKLEREQDLLNELNHLKYKFNK